MLVSGLLSFESPTWRNDLPSNAQSHEHAGPEHERIAASRLVNHVVAKLHEPLSLPSTTNTNIETTAHIEQAEG